MASIGLWNGAGALEKFVPTVGNAPPASIYDRYQMEISDLIHNDTLELF
jgi:hypothetical protein